MPPVPAQVYVAHLDQRASEEDVRAMFSPFGPVLNVRIIIDRDTGASKGYGFVTMAAPAMAQVRVCWMQLSPRSLSHAHSCARCLRRNLHDMVLACARAQ